MKCGECKYFKSRKRTENPTNDGECLNEKHTGKNRKTPYLVFSMAHACFASEAPDGQMELEL